MQLNTVVLPAPFGPMRAVISPRRALNESSLIASRPPKRMVNRSTRSTAADAADAVVRSDCAEEAAAPGVERLIHGPRARAGLLASPPPDGSGGRTSGVLRGMPTVRAL